VSIWSEMQQAVSDAWGVATDRSLDELVSELGPLVDQLTQIDAGLCAARDATTWSGPAADAFRAAAHGRSAQIRDLVCRLQGALEQAGAAAKVPL
jgi:hypothetical protein